MMRRPNRSNGWRRLTLSIDPRPSREEEQIVPESGSGKSEIRAGSNVKTQKLKELCEAFHG